MVFNFEIAPRAVFHELWRLDNLPSSHHDGVGVEEKGAKYRLPGPCSNYSVPEDVG